MKPIIKSFLDRDRYKFTMGQFISFKYPKVIVENTFFNRTKDEDVREILVYLIPYINQQFELLSKLRITFSEMAYMKSTGIYREEYLNFLSQLNLIKLKAEKIELDGKSYLSIKYSG